jgi:hypothetical protein
MTQYENMKLFTIEEANRLLPTVRGILLRLRVAHGVISSMRGDAKLAASGAEQGGGGMPEGTRYVRALTTLSGKSQELDHLGVQIKDYERGLIDFPTMRDGRVVLLCWQLGEHEALTWWHDVDAGFAGRQPL